MLSEINQTKRDKNGMIPFMRYLEWAGSQIQKVEHRLPGTGGGRNGNYCSMGTENLSGMIKCPRNEQQ